MHLNLFEIPPVFHSSDTGAPIERCLVCDKKLLDSGEEYMLEKAFANYPALKTRDIIWEIAICFDCMEMQRQEFSEESNQRIAEYFQTHADFTRHRELIESQNYDPSEWISHCVITGKPASECSQYQVYAQCIGAQCLFDATPFMISDEAMDEVAKLISNKTLDSMNDFRDRYLPTPEDLSPFFRDKDFVLL